MHARIASCETPNPRKLPLNNTPLPIGLLNKSTSPTCAPLLRQQRLWVHDPGHGQAEFGLVVVGRMATGQHRAGLGDFTQRSLDDTVHDLWTQVLARKGHKVEARQRLSPHRVDVTQRIGRTDLTKHKGVVHRWRNKKISRNDDSLLVVEPIYPGVIAGLKADQQVAIPVGGQRRKQFFQSDRTGFSRSPAGLCQTR